MNSLKICIVNTDDFVYGAGKAAFRLHKGLKSIGVNSKMFVQKRVSDDPNIVGNTTHFSKGLSIFKPTFDTLPLKFYKKRGKAFFSTQWLPSNIDTKINALKYDVINLHWICGGFIPISSLAKMKAPLVWTLHDMWPFTGGCHYAGNCEGYLKKCGSCPQLSSKKSWDLSRCVWERKNYSWRNLDLTVVTPSHWLADCAKRSSLFQNFPIEVIPNGLDTNIYKPINKKIARNILNLPQKKKIILFGAVSSTSDRRKGFHFLIPALQKLSLQKNEDDYELIVFGSSSPTQDLKLPFKTTYLGRLNDDIALSIVYSAADVFICPSMEDNLPNTVVESLACATPCVGFRVGGLSDIIDHKENGYLVNPFDIDALADGIDWIFNDTQRYSYLSSCARTKVEAEFNMQLQAQRYLNLYKSKII